MPNTIRPMRNWSPLRFVLVDAAVTLLGAALAVLLVLNGAGQAALLAVVIPFALVSGGLAYAWVKAHPPSSRD